MLQTREQKEVTAFFFSYWHGLVYLSFSSSHHFERLFVIHSGADDLFLWPTIFDVRYVPRSGSEVLNKNFSYWQRMLTRSMLDLFRYRI